MLKLRTTKETTIDCGDWDRFVEKTYGRPYCLQQQNGCRGRGTLWFSVPGDSYDFKNDTVPEIVNHEDRGVSFKAWLARDPKQFLSDKKDLFGLGLWWHRNFYPSVEAVAFDLHKRGLLEAGEYRIIIDW